MKNTIASFSQSPWRWHLRAAATGQFKKTIMSNLNLRNITNDFQDVRLVSLHSWRQAHEISPRDHRGPYVVLQEGYDPEDMKMIPTEFMIGRSGKWLPLAHFYQLPIPDRRAEFIFGTAAEVMQMMRELPSKAEILRHKDRTTEPTADDTEIAAAIKAWKNRAGVSDNSKSQETKR